MKQLTRKRIIIFCFAVTVSGASLWGINKLFNYISYKSSVNEIIDAYHLAVKELRSEYSQEISLIDETINTNSLLWNACQENEEKLSVTFHIGQNEINKEINCSLLQPGWSYENTQLRKDKQEKENELCIETFNLAHKHNQWLQDISEKNQRPLEIVPTDTSCYDGSHLGLNDKRRVQSITSVTLHHTATGLLPVDKIVASASRHHGVAPAHFFIDADGEVRATRDIDEVVGATLDPIANRKSIHIELVGNFLNGQQPTPKQLNALIELLTSLGNKYPNLRTITGHRYWNSPTTCPGDLDFYGIVDRLPGWQVYSGIEPRQVVNKVAVTQPITPVAEVKKKPAVNINEPFKVTVYHSFEGGACPDGDINCLGNSLVPASGWTFTEDMAGYVVACPPQMALGTKLQLHHPELGERTVTCFDRGSAIVGNRLDLRIGIKGRTVFPSTKTFYNVTVTMLDE